MTYFQNLERSVCIPFISPEWDRIIIQKMTVLGASPVPCLVGHCAQSWGKLFMGKWWRWGLNWGPASKKGRIKGADPYPTPRQRGLRKTEATQCLQSKALTVYELWAPTVHQAPCSGGGEGAQVRRPGWHLRTGGAMMLLLRSREHRVVPGHTPAQLPISWVRTCEVLFPWHAVGT